MRNNTLYHATFAKFVCYMFFAFGLIALACKAYGFFVWLSTPLLVMYIFRMFDLEFTFNTLNGSSNHDQQLVDLHRINPATGFMMIGDFDTAGNQYGMSSMNDETV